MPGIGREHILCLWLYIHIYRPAFCWGWWFIDLSYTYLMSWN